VISEKIRMQPGYICARTGCGPEEHHNGAPISNEETSTIGRTKANIDNWFIIVMRKQDREVVQI
jgi:hypothetical protein